MMGVYIANMGMPEKCSLCILEVHDTEESGYTHNYRCPLLIAPTLWIRDRNRLEYCPLAEVPPHERMEEQTYLFAFKDETLCEISCNTTFKDAVWEMAKCTGNSSEMFRKSLFSEEFEAVGDIVCLFNNWCCYSMIKAVYVVNGKLYEEE